MATTHETFTIEAVDGQEFDVDVSFFVEPTEYEGPFVFYRGSYSSGETVDAFILRYADAHHKGQAPVSRYPMLY